MGKIDQLTKAYLSDNARYADIINYYVFDGEEVVLPEELEEVDTEELIVLKDKDGQDEAIERFRDLIRRGVVRTAKGMTFVLFAIENQREVHYAMPVREMLYDAVNYSNQIREITKAHRDAGCQLTGTEFLSGIRREDRIHPVITICIYWGSDRWDGPRSLHDMLGTQDERLLRFVSDYRFNLIVPAEIREFDRFRTDFGSVMEAVAASPDADQLQKLLKDKAELYGKDDTEMTALLNALLGVQFETTESEETNMTLAQGIQVLVDRGETRGENAKLISQVRRKMERGQDAAEIADDLLESLEDVERIMDAIESLPPTADNNEIYQKLMGDTVTA